MRKDLKEMDGTRLRFRARVERFGSKTTYRDYEEKTILLKNITRVDNGLEVTDHLWFTVGKTIDALDLQPGDMVEFDARVANYVKGYVNHRRGVDDRKVDYKLSRPTRFVRLADDSTKQDVEAIGDR